MTHHQNHVHNPVMTKDELVLLDILPQVVWEVVLRKMKPSTRLNTINSSLFFHELSKKDLMSCVLPDVFKVFGDWLLAQEHSRKIGVNTSVNTMLKLRLVSKEFRDAVDGSYEVESFKMLNSVTPILSCITFDMSRTYEFSEGRLYNFLKQFGKLDVRKNPFIGRAIVLREREQPVSYHYRFVRKLLEMFGEHVWYLQQDVNELDDSLEDIYLAIAKRLKLVPNLKELTVVWLQGYQYDDEQTMGDKNEDLSKIVNKTPLTKLNFLTKLSVTDLPESVLDALLTANCDTIEHLGIYCNTSKCSYDFSKFQFPRLKEFFIELDDSMQMQWYVKHSLRAVSNVGTCGFFRDDTFQPQSFEEWLLPLKVVQKAVGSSESVEDLKFFVPRLPSLQHEIEKVFAEYENLTLLAQPSSSSSTYLPLSRLESVYIDLNDYIGIDMLTFSHKTLKRLVIFARKGLLTGKQCKKRKSLKYRLMLSRQKVELFGFANRMYESNIWQTFENLKFLDITQYNELQSKGTVDTESSWPTLSYYRSEWLKKQKLTRATSRLPIGKN